MSFFYRSKFFFRVNYTDLPSTFAKIQVPPMTFQYYTDLPYFNVSVNRFPLHLTSVISLDGKVNIPYQKLIRSVRSSYVQIKSLPPLRSREGISPPKILFQFQHYTPICSVSSISNKRVVLGVAAKTRSEQRRKVEEGGFFYVNQSSTSFFYVNQSYLPRYEILGFMNVVWVF